MNAGKLRFRVVVEKTVPIENETGEQEIVWRPIRSEWAKIEPLTGIELVRAQQVDLVTTHKVSMRWFPGLTSDHRLNFGGRILNISSLINVGEMNTEWQMQCIEVK